MAATVEYADFKTLEHNVRAAFDKLRQLNALVSDTVALVRDMQTRLSNIEAALHGTAQRGGPDGAA